MTWRYSPSIVWESVDDTVFLTTPDLGEIQLLEGTADLIWGELPGRSTDELVAALADLAALDPSDIDDDVRDFLGELASRGLIEDAVDG